MSTLKLRNNSAADSVTMASEEKISPSEIYNAIFKNMRFWVDENNDRRFFAEYKRRDGYWEFREVKDARFSAYVRSQFREKTGEDIAPSFGKYLEKYTDIAMVEGKSTAVHIRIAGDKNRTIYYLADDKNLVYLIDKSGFKPYKAVPDFKFIKTANSLAQVKPKTGKGLLDTLRPFINMDNDMFILFTVNLVQQFICTSSHFLSVISSSKGTGKTILMRFWHRIIDPTRSETTAMPTNPDELKNHLANNKVVCYDNTQPLSIMFSDILCGAVTGTTFSKRKLYTDCAEIIQRIHNTVILNGINVIPQKSDLLERSLLFKLQKIKDEDRVDEKTLEENFTEALPYILGDIFNILVEYYKVKGSVKVIGNHRMSGAYKDCYVIATILKVEKEFVRAFNSNQLALQKGYAETNSLISAITSYFEDVGKQSVKGAVAEIYNNILPYADNTFPKSPSAFSRAIQDEKDNLIGAGFAVMKMKQRMCTQLRITYTKSTESESL